MDVSTVRPLVGVRRAALISRHNAAHLCPRTVAVRKGYEAQRIRVAAACDETTMA
jgi:hypothetical protein